MRSEDLYPQSVIEGINAIVQECLNGNSRSAFRATAVNYLTSILESTDKDIFPSDAYRCIWYNLIKFERCGELDWIKAYWEYAVSYAQFSLQSYSINDIKDEFLFKSSNVLRILAFMWKI